MKPLTYIATAVLASALFSFPAAALAPFNYQVVELYGVPLFDKPIHVVIRTHKEWASFRQLPGDWPQPPPTVPGQHITRGPRPPISETDFDRYSLVVIGIGATTGYQLAVSEIREMPQEVWVRYAVIRPGTNCAVAQELGHLSLSLLIPKTTKPVRFHETAAVMDCSNSKNSSEMGEFLGKR